MTPESADMCFLFLKRKQLGAGVSMKSADKNPGFFFKQSRLNNSEITAESVLLHEQNPAANAIEIELDLAYKTILWTQSLAIWLKSCYFFTIYVRGKTFIICTLLFFTT